MTERGPKGIRRWWKRFGEIWPEIVEHERFENRMGAAGYLVMHENPFYESYVKRGIIRARSRLDWSD